MSQRITKVLGLVAFTGLSGLMCAQTLNWAPAGPIYNAGRARNMIVDKNNSKVLYVGSASSGIFKSTDGGSNWAPVNDQAIVRNISYMAQSTNGDILVGTGEGFLRTGQKAKAQVGTGLYKLDESVSPAALNLIVSSSVVGTVINRVACNPNNSTHIALATNLGIFVSTNGGGSFTQANLIGASTGSTVSGQDVKFDSNGILYCSIGSEAGTSTVTPSKVYKSTDAVSLNGYTEITPVSTALTDSNYGRIELAIAPSDNNVIYASCSNKYASSSSATLKGLFVSYNAGQSWALMIQGSPQLDPLSNGGTIASGDYAHVLSVNPSNPHQLFIGGYSFYVFTRTNNSTTNPIGDWVPLGQSFFRNSQSYLHENIHDIKFVVGNPSIIYFITDAGIYRSIDLAPLLGNLAANVSIGNFPSSQPFYKGLVTGQYNSVSIERYPIGLGIGDTAKGSKVTPYSGFIGGTGGNGLTYFSGTYSLVTTELSYIGGEVYNAEYSKILSNAAYASTGNGRLFRSTNVKISDPAIVDVNKYVNALSRIAPEPYAFTNSGVTTGTPFRLWENYGQISSSPDSVAFYNDSVRYQASMAGIPELTSKTTFTFSTSRPNKFALIDSIVVRTGTVQLPIDGTYSNLQTPYNAPGDRQTIYASVQPRDYTVSPTLSTTLTSSTTGVSSVPITFTLNPTNLIDNITVTFTAPPFATKTITQYPPTATGTNIIVPDAAVYYRVFATVYYRYKAGDVVTMSDNNISTKTNTYSATLTQPLNWRYGSLSSSTISALTNTINLSIPSPTYVLNPGNVTQANPVFTVSPSNPSGVTVFTITASGTYTLLANPVIYTISAATDTNIPSPYVYSISPGNFTQATNVFTVNPLTSTNYTITQSGSSGTLTLDTYSTIGTSTYVLNPGNVTQSNTVFIITPTATANYTIQGLSSNTLAGANTSGTFATVVSSTTFSVGAAGGIPLAPSNKPVKVKSSISARLAVIMNNVENTAGQDAIAVSKNPLALNDPLSFVRVSTTGPAIWTDDASGNPTTNTIVVSGKPILLEWSKSGTEIYYATSTNRLYRVSHITTIMDLSPSSFSGKFYTDLFRYAAPINNATLNPVSPYRTTLIGTFDRPITSISVTNDDKNLAVTFNSTGTGTTSTVMYCTGNARTSNETNISWSGRQGTLPGSVTTTYCSLIEKNDSKKFFIGTDNGMFYTSDISVSSPNWFNVNNNSTSKLPSVQIFDIKQQTFGAGDCYNSGQIYVATNGRGIWTNGTFFAPYTVGVEERGELTNGNNLSVYPNPTNAKVNVVFNAVDGETATIQVLDISGRLVQSEDLGKLNSGEVTHSFETNTLNSGIYIVNISSNSNVKRVTKLIVTK